MRFINDFYFKSVKYNFINKFVCKNIKTLPKLKTITLNFHSKQVNIKKILGGLLFFELILNQKGTLTKTKNAIISVKIRKGNPVGCKLILKKQNLLKICYSICTSFSLRQKHLNKKNNVSFKMVNPLKNLELEKHYYFFNNLPVLNVTITTTINNCKEFFIFFKLLKFF